MSAALTWLLGQLGGWRGYLAALAVGAAAAGWASWQVQGWRKDAQIERTNAAWAGERAAWAGAAAVAQAAARDEEARRQAAIDEVRNEGEKELARRVAVERAAADVRLRDAAAEYARRGRQAAGGARAAQPGAAAADPIGVLAVVLGELDGMAEVYAAEADAARHAGLMCERAYDALSAP